MTDSIAGPPSPFISQWVSSLSSSGATGQRALDVACGKGRHALVLASAGFEVTAIDLQMDMLHVTRASAHARGLRVSLICADLTQMPLPRERFDLVVVTRYLDRERGQITRQRRRQTTRLCFLLAGVSSEMAARHR